jgi:VIT1/CCC1 family predicted Fe2+/Mn2+ transporter
MGLIPILHLTDHLSIPILAVLVALAGAVRGAGDTGNRVLIPGLADDARMPLERASGLFDGGSRIASMIGVPLAGVLIASGWWVTVGLVTAALAVTGSVSARLGGAPAGRAVLRNVGGGLLAMAITFGLGSLIGTAL